MNALYIILPALCLMAIAYRYYSAFLAAKVAVLDDLRVTPAHTKYDGHNYHPMGRWVLFGHHFAAITGAGPLIGPVLAAQFGFLPGLLWLVIGVCLAGAVHDFMILWASTRRGGRSLAEIARDEIGPVAGFTTAIAILFIIIVALAGLGLAVVNALRDSAWGVFTIGTTIPIAIVMGLYMYRWRKGAVRSATIAGVTALIFAVIAGRWVGEAEWGRIFVLNTNQLVVALAVYGFAASVLPVWLLLAPRDYLSTFMKLGTVGFLILGVFIVQPTLHMPAISTFTQGGGPIVPGSVFPFVFITIACGAISGFHGLIGSGTTPKMVNKESDIRPIGYGAMLMEGVVGIVALVAASALFPGDYFAINVAPEKFAQLGIPEVNLAMLSQQVGENVEGRPGGAVSLAVGMAQIFSALPGMRGLMSVLVPLRDHVRGALHPHDDRRRHAGGALHSAGVRGPLLRPARPSRLDPRIVRRDADRRRVLGLLHFCGKHPDDLADVRDRQPAPGDGCAVHRDHGADQRRSGAIRMGDVRAHVVCRHHDGDGWRPERPRHLLADGDRAGSQRPRAGLRQHIPDGRHARLCRGHPGRGRTALAVDRKPRKARR